MGVFRQYISTKADRLLCFMYKNSCMDVYSFVDEVPWSMPSVYNSVQDILVDWSKINDSGWNY